MKSVFLNRLLKKISKRKWLLVLSVFLFIGIFGYIGRDQVQKIVLTGNDQATAPDPLQSEEYKAAIQSYDDSIASVQQTIEIASQQLAIQQQYCDNSPYMQMDGNNYYIATSVYYLHLASKNIGGDTWPDNSGNILTVVAQYMTVDHLSAVVQEQMPEINAEYLAEILNCNFNGYFVSISVLYKNKEEALEIRSIVEQDFQEHVSEQIKLYGEEYELDLLDDIVVAKGDAAVLNTQNGNLNNLRTYQTNLADIQKKAADLQAAKQQYMASAAAASSTDAAGQQQKSPKIMMLCYIGIGALIGLLLPLIVMAITLVVDDKVGDIGDIARLGLFTFGNLNDGTAGENLVNYLKKRKIDCVFFSLLTESIAAADKRQLEEQLSDLEIACGFGYLDQQQPGNDIKQFISADGCVLAITLEQTSIGQIQEQIEVCRRMDIPVLGCVQV